MAKLSIVVADDSVENIAAAMVQFSRHHLYTLGNAEQVEELLAGRLHRLQGKNYTGQCDTAYYKIGQTVDIHVLLLDLLMPAPRKELMENVYKKQNAQPESVGINLAILGSICRIPLIGVLTDSNHHKDVYSAMFNWFQQNLTVMGSSYGVINLEGTGEEVPQKLTINSSNVFFSNNRKWIEETGKRWDLFLHYMLKNK